MSHSTDTTHSSNQGHSTNQSHKHIIEQFADAINGNHLNNLHKYLDDNVEKSINSEVIYKDLKEARDYYAKEHSIKKTVHWKVVHFTDSADQKENTAQARLSYDNKTYNTTYTFSPSGKIQRIDAVIENNQNTPTTTTHP